MIAVLILIPVVGFALFTLVCYKTDWKAIDVITIYIKLPVLLVYGFPVCFVTDKGKQGETDNRDKD